jgi:diguanylate cyclase (GGDEF)-like protein/PAS domain S-box-containing protein
LTFLSFATRLLNTESWAAGGVTIVWPTNGFLVGVLLCTRKRYWTAYLLVGFAIDLMVNLSMHDLVYGAVYLSGCNILEMTLAAYLLHPVIASKPDLTERRQFTAFLLYGVLLAPFTASALASCAQNGRFVIPTILDFFRWFTADALGIAIVTPLCLALNERQLFRGRSWAEVLGLFALLSGVTIAVFAQTRFPFLFVVSPFLLLLSVRLGLAGSALGLLLVSIVGGAFSSVGRGPVALMGTSPLAQRDMVFQFFVAIAMLLVYVVEVLLSESRHLEADLRGSERRFRLLAEASSDIISLTDLRGVRHYVSPASLEVLGWQASELMGGSFKDLVHPDDLAVIERTFEDYRNGAPPRSVEYRCRKPDGSYVWVETKQRLHRDPDTGEPAGFVKVTRDISVRKVEEEEQQRAFETVEQMASSDALTGIANRRHFDLVLEREWHRAAREQASLSLLLMDVDRFKNYNDLYGHVNGDECLKQVVEAIKPLICRPADLLARYGGEEFVVILPNTDPIGARQMAEWIRRAVEWKRIPHPGNPPHAVITLSVGCASVVPNPSVTLLHLLEAADEALYRAKSTGRNRIHGGKGWPDPDTVLLMN